MANIAPKIPRPRRRARLPRKLIIAGRTYSVRMLPCKALSEAARRVGLDPGEGLDGLCLHGTQEILIDRGLSDEQRVVAYVHEACHAILSATGASVLAGIDAGQEETIVHALSGPLTHVMKGVKL